MRRWKRAVLILLGLGMAVVMVAFWGSIASVVMAFGLIELIAALLYQRFLNKEDSRQWDYE